METYVDYGDTCVSMAITTVQELLLYFPILTLLAWKKWTLSLQGLITACFHMAIESND